MTDGVTCPAVGPAPETVMRLLSGFREEGLLRTEKRAVTLLAPERLTALPVDRFGASLAEEH